MKSTSKGTESMMLMIVGVVMAFVLFSFYGGTDTVEGSDDDAAQAMSRAAERISGNSFVKRLLGDR